MVIATPPSLRPIGLACGARIIVAGNSTRAGCTFARAHNSASCMTMSWARMHQTRATPTRNVKTVPTDVRSKANSFSHPVFEMTREQQIDALRQTIVEAATACNKALPRRILLRGGVCEVSLRVPNVPQDKPVLRVTLTLDGGPHHAVAVASPNEDNIIRQALDCIGMHECWFDSLYSDQKGNHK